MNCAVKEQGAVHNVLCCFPRSFCLEVGCSAETTLLDAHSLRLQAIALQATSCRWGPGAQAEARKCVAPQAYAHSHTRQNMQVVRCHQHLWLPNHLRGL